MSDLENLLDEMDKCEKTRNHAIFWLDFHVDDTDKYKDESIGCIIDELKKADGENWTLVLSTFHEQQMKIDKLVNENKMLSNSSLFASTISSLQDNCIEYINENEILSKKLKGIRVARQKEIERTKKLETVNILLARVHVAAITSNDMVVRYLARSNGLKIQEIMENK